MPAAVRCAAKRKGFDEVDGGHIQGAPQGGGRCHDPHVGIIVIIGFIGPEVAGEVGHIGSRTDQPRFKAESVEERLESRPRRAYGSGHVDEAMALRIAPVSTVDGAYAFGLEADHQDGGALRRLHVAKSLPGDDGDGAIHGRIQGGAGAVGQRRNRLGREQRHGVETLGQGGGQSALQRCLGNDALPPGFP